MNKIAIKEQIDKYKNYISQYQAEIERLEAELDNKCKIKPGHYYKTIEQFSKCFYRVHTINNIINGTNCVCADVISFVKSPTTYEGNYTIEVDYTFNNYISTETIESIVEEIEPIDFTSKLNKIDSIQY